MRPWATGLFLSLITLTFRGYSQDIAIEGQVTDGVTREALIGVNIYAEDLRLRGTTTDFDGNYSMEIAPGSRLVFRYVGYNDTSFVLWEPGTLNVVLQPASLDLNTVVVSASRRKEKILDAPAAISVIGSDKLKSKAAVNTQDYLKNVSGVHIIKSGIQGGTPTVRGFGGYYSSNLMTLVDNRSAQVPNFRLNAYNLISTTTDDLERIEVLKGPASALYGPNTSEGVVHMITKSPIDAPQTKFSAGIGIRTAIKDTLKVNSGEPRFDSRDAAERVIGTLDFRQADTIHVKRPGLQMGYKVSSAFFRGLDWKYHDPNDPAFVVRYIPSADGIIPLRANGTPLTPQEIAAGETGSLVENERNESITKFSIDTRLDLRIRRETELIFAGGFNISNSIDMTPIGGTQQVGWKYSYFQTRLLWRNFFVQGYANFSNSGDSYYLPTGGMIIDRSRYYALQAQHFWEPLKTLKFTYGADAFFTRANTDYTLNGRYEEADAINEAGVYLQGDYAIHPRLTLLAATRMDYHNQIRRPFFSPRVAVLYKAGTGQNVRLTFNRAFRTAGTSAYFIDVRQAELPTQIGIRALGTQNSGFQYSFDRNPYFENALLPQFRTPFASDPYAYYNVGDGSVNNAGWLGILQGIKSELPKQFGLAQPIDIVDQLVDAMIAALLPSELLTDIDHVVKDLNATTRTFEASDWQNLRDIEGLKPVITYTYEVGYKGLVANFLLLSLDFYKTDHKNYLAPVTFVSPGVLLDADMVMEEVAPILEANLQDPDNEAYSNLLLALLDRNEALGGNNNGTAFDELAGFIHQAVGSLPIGTITPVQATGPEMLLVTRNIGDVSVYGMEAGVSVFLSRNARLDTYYAWVDKDSIIVPGAQFGYVALNAPRHRFSVGGNYTIEPIGLSLGARFNWQAGFPANSGSFVGRVASYHEMDVDLSWSPVFRENLSLTLSISNLYNHVHQHFIGSPEIGMMALFKASYTL